MVYSLETLIAEKYETIIKQNITTTRLRDFYDIYMIFKLKSDKINIDNLKRAILETSKNRILHIQNNIPIDNKDEIFIIIHVSGMSLVFIKHVIRLLSTNVNRLLKK